MASLVFKNISTSLISTVANYDVVAILIDVKLTNKIIHLEFWQLSHPLWRQSLSLFLLLEAFKVLKDIVDKVCSHSISGFFQEFMLVPGFFINLLVEKVSFFDLL